MFFAEMLCFIPYLIYKAFRTKKNFLEVSGLMKLDCPFYLPIIPGVMDLLASALAYVSLNLIAGSVWQISRGGVIITTAIFSRLCLSKKFTKSSLLGCILSFVGITLVQLFQILLTSSQSTHTHSTTQQIIGIALLLISLIFNTIALITQKMIFNKYSIHPLKMVYLEGFYGFVGISAIIAVVSFIQCPEVGTIRDKCILVDGGYYIESFTVFIQQISKNTALLMYIIGLLFSIGISVPIAVTISKVINPVSRSLADVCRTVIIWAFCLLLTVTVGTDNPYYNLQKTGTLLNLLKLIGFVMVVVGTLIYHDVIKVFKDKAEDIKQSLLLSQDDEQKKEKKEKQRKSNSGKKNKDEGSQKNSSRESLM